MPNGKFDPSKHDDRTLLIHLCYSTARLEEGVKDLRRDVDEARQERGDLRQKLNGIDDRTQGLERWRARVTAVAAFVSAAVTTTGIWLKDHLARWWFGG